MVCTHGEVITLLLDGAECAKGAFWIIERRNDRLIPVLYVDAYLPPARGRSERLVARGFEAGSRSEPSLEGES